MEELGLTTAIKVQMKSFNYKLCLEETHKKNLTLSD